MPEFEITARIAQQASTTKQQRRQTSQSRHMPRIWRIFVRFLFAAFIVFELLPTMTSLIVAAFLNAALYSILTAAGLEFLGLGNTSSVDWGTMLYWAQNNEALGANMVYWAIMPGVCVALLGAAFALLNYAFDEISNPALRPVKKSR